METTAIVPLNFTKQQTSPLTISTNLLGDTMTNEYIPFIHCFTNNIICKTMDKNNKEVKFAIYNLTVNVEEYTPPHKRNSYEIARANYTNLFNYLYYHTSFNHFATDNIELQIAKGAIIQFNKFTDKYDILMLLAVKKEFYWKMNPQLPNPNHFVLFINGKFATDDEFSSIYKKIKKEYIDILSEKGIDVIFTNDIRKWCYSNTVYKPKFNTVNDMTIYMDSLNDIMYE